MSTALPSHVWCVSVSCLGVIRRYGSLSKSSIRHSVFLSVPNVMRHEMRQSRHVPPHTFPVKPSSSPPRGIYSSES